MNDILKRIDDPTEFTDEQSERAAFIAQKIMHGKSAVDFNEYSEIADYPMWISENDKMYFLDESNMIYLRFDPPENTQYIYGLYGRIREQFLKIEKEDLYNELLGKGKLKRHLAEIDKRASDLEEMMIDQMSESEGITSELKKKDMLEWVGRYNNLKNRVREVIFNELIYV